MFIPTKQEKLNRIYEVIANKELSFGCSYQEKIQEEILPTIKTIAFHPKEGDKFPLHYMKIIGHPVMIGDFLKWMETSKPYKPDCTCGFDGELRKILGLWSKINLPIDEQSDECIDYIYSLIK